MRMWIQTWAAALLLGAAGAAAAADPLLRLEIEHPVGGVPNVLTIQVFADGTVDADYPAYMTRAGRWRMQISARELETIATAVRDAGVADMDRERLRAEVAAVPGRSPEHIYVGDGVVTRLTVNLGPYSGQAVEPNTITWIGLKPDAARLDAVPGLQALAGVQDLLEGLADDPRMQRLPPSGR